MHVAMRMSQAISDDENVNIKIYQEGNDTSLYG